MSNRRFVFDKRKGDNGVFTVMCIPVVDWSWRRFPKKFNFKSREAYFAWVNPNWERKRVFKTLLGALHKSGSPGAAALNSIYYSIGGVYISIIIWIIGITKKKKKISHPFWIVNSHRYNINVFNRIVFILIIHVLYQ